ncbi:MAG: ATP-dependent DNA helicase [Candidatus Woesearchaeota archaeon]
MSVLFPHAQVRSVQSQMMYDAGEALKKRKHFVAHAPTGLGKTAATLSPALDLALKRDLVVFFLTSRHTQHKIVLDTLQAIRKRHNVDFITASIIGKKWMCAQQNVTTMRSNDFFPYCKALRESKSCEPYENVKQKVQCDVVLSDAEKDSPLPTEEIIRRCSEKNLCPYELSIRLAEKSKVIVTDYYYLLHPHIRNAFLKKAKKSLEQAIIIFDEGHNLPARARELMTQRISSRLIAGAAKEAKKYRFNDLAVTMEELNAVLESLARGLQIGGEKLVRREHFLDAVSRFADLEELVAKLDAAANTVRQDRQRSMLGTIAEFLESWAGSDEGFSRILVKQPSNIQLTRRCLDPSLVTKDLIEGSYCTITMSGTLSPASVFADLLGIPEENRIAKEYPSPFPAQNRLAFVVPRTTTKFSQRSDAQYKAIAEHCAKIINQIPGCTAIFFPSYQIRDAVNRIFVQMTGKTIFLEQPGMTKEQKQEFLERFRKYTSSGAALLGVASGSFGEGIDLPGILRGVVIVGVPLDRPNLETQQLIEYYDRKFGKGWDYGYIMPALTKTMQNAGRCIRSETDKGVIVFLDERYAWPKYFSCFPSDWNLRISPDPASQIAAFFAKS